MKMRTMSRGRMCWVERKEQLALSDGRVLEYWAKLRDTLGASREEAEQLTVEKYGEASVVREWEM